MSDLPGYLLFAAIAVLGLGSTVVGTMRAWTWLRGRGVPVAASIALTILFATLTFGGLWLVLDLYWLIRAATRGAQRLAVRPTDPAT